MVKVLLCLIISIFSIQAIAVNEGSDSDVLDGSEALKTEVQTTPVVVPEPASNQKNVEKISVTGSRIKRIDAEGPSPVLTLDQDYLERSGYNSVADVLRDTTISSFGVEREYSDESNSVGAATIGLRGLGADRTLVLLDGRRLPKIDGGNSVDLNLIPFSAIERVEILKDGASAIYGSDALAGVINFITKKDFDGSEIRTRFSIPEEKGGQRQTVAATYGKNFRKGNVLAIYQYRNNQRIMDQDRPWSQGAVSGYGSPGSYRKLDDTSKWQAMPNCPPERVRWFPDGSSDCIFDYSVYTSGLPDTEQHSGMLRGNYELKNGLNTFATTTYTHRQVRWQWAPSADDFNDARNVGGSNHTIPSKVLGKNGVPNASSGVYELRYRTVDELGARASRDTTDAYGAVVGVQGEMMDTWEWETSMNYGYSQLYNSRHAGYGNKENLYNSIVDGELNVFGPNSTAINTSDFYHHGEQYIRTNVSTAQFTTSGELGQALGSTVLLATGVSSTWEGYEVVVDDVTAAGNLYGGIGESGQGTRNFQSVFSEMGFNWKSVEVLMAGRFDNYSDFGTTVNPKLSLRYSPFKFMMLRGSAGTGFRAPSLDQLYSNSSYRYPWFVDTSACAQFQGAYCDEQQYRVFSGGNPNLKEERSLSYNIGTVIQPTREFSIGVDFWETRVKNSVGLDFNDLMYAESVLGPDALAAEGVLVNRNNGVISEIVAPNLNLAQQQSRGLELMLSHSFKAGPLTIQPRMDHSHLLVSREEVFPGLGFRDKLGERGRPEWRNNVSLNFGLFNHGMRWMARTIAGQYKIEHLSDPTATGRIPTYTEYDLNYNYLTSWQGEFNFGVKNLLASNRPLDDSAGFSNRFNTQLYDQVGRMFYMGYAQPF